MTKEEAIKILQCRGNGYSEKDFNDALEVAYDALYESQLSSNLNKAAEEYAWMKEEPLSEGERLSFCFNPRIDAFKAGAEWRDAQIPKLPNSIDEVAENRVTENGRFKITSFEKMRIEDIMFGAEWMAKQGVYAYCIESSNPVSESPDIKYHCITLEYEENENTPYVRAGDRVKVILRKI